jgi:hypothetical protein
MKKIFFCTTIACLMAFAQLSWAQTSTSTSKETKITSTDTIRPKYHQDTIRRTLKRDTSAWKRKVDSATAAISRKTKETGAKAVAAVKDCSLKNVKGPKGETVYVDEHDRRYYINKDGNKVFMKRPATK